VFSFGKFSHPGDTSNGGTPNGTKDFFFVFAKNKLKSSWYERTIAIFKQYVPTSCQNIRGILIFKIILFDF